MYQENIFFHYILNDQIFLNSAKPEFFSNQTLKDLFIIAKEHAINYKEAPSKEQLVELIRIKGLGEKYSEDIITALYNSKEQLKQYDENWLKDNIGPWIKIRNLENVMRKSISYMKMNNNMSPENASDVVEKVRHMMSSETAVDFSFNLGCDFFDPAAHLQTRLERTNTGYPYIDKCLKGGWWKGSLIVFMAPPKSGKSMMMCNLASLSMLNGSNTAYITLELQQELVNMRIGSNLLNIPLDDYDEFVKDQDRLRNKLNDLRQSSLKSLGKLHVKEFASSTMSVNDLKTYLVKAQEILGYKFDNIFVDYINIMKNWRNPNTENLYMKIKQISEDLRAIAQEEQWAIITPTQVNKCLSPLTIINHREKGKIQLKDLKNGDYILGDLGYVKVKNIWHNKNTKTYKIKTKSGKEIICSKNHVFPVNNKLSKLENIKIGDKIYSKRNMKAEDLEILEDEIISIEEFDIIDTIDVEIDSRSRLFFANDILTHNSGFDTSDLTISNVSESSALLHTVDGLFGIITNPEMKAKGEYYIKYLADRVSGLENTRKRFEFNRKYARITEDINSQIEDMDFIAGSIGGFKKTSSQIHAVINENTSDISTQNFNVSGNSLFDIK